MEIGPIEAVFTEFNEEIVVFIVDASEAASISESILTSVSVVFDTFVGVGAASSIGDCCCCSVVLEFVGGIW